MPGHGISLKRETDAEFMARAKPALESIEFFRQGKSASWRRRRAAAILLTIPAALAGLTVEIAIADHWHLDDDTPFFFLICVAMLWAWARAPKGTYQKLYKETVVPKIAAALGLSHYDAKGAIPLTDIACIKFLPAMRDYKPEDFFEGFYRDARVRFSRATIKPQEKFGGVLLLIDLPKPLCRGAVALVTPQNALGSWFGGKQDLRRLDAADKKLDFFAEDPAEAAPLLAPAMKGAEALAKAYSSDDISIVLYRSQVFAMISCDRDFLEPGDVTQPATNTEDALAIKKEVDQVLDLVDFLNL